MWPFTHKKSEVLVEPTFAERLDRLTTRQSKLEAEFMDLLTAHDILRNKVLRKIQHKKEMEEEEESNKRGEEGKLLPM